MRTLHGAEPSAETMDQFRLVVHRVVKVGPVSCAPYLPEKDALIDHLERWLACSGVTSILRLLPVRLGAWY